MNRFWIVPALLAVIGAGASPELEPYRALARNAAACDSLLSAARSGLARGVDAGEPVSAAAPDWPGSPRPVYVTLAHGRVTRACVGADAPLGGSLGGTLASLGEQVVANDRRHPPLADRELDSLRLVVAFAGDPHAVADPYTVDPLREGLRVETDRGAVAFLPGEARTVAWALREARRIGVLAGPLADARFSRFAVVTVQGPARAKLPARR